MVSVLLRNQEAMDGDPNPEADAGVDNTPLPTTSRDGVVVADGSRGTTTTGDDDKVKKKKKKKSKRLGKNKKERGRGGSSGGSTSATSNTTPEDYNNNNNADAEAADPILYSRYNGYSEEDLYEMTRTANCNDVVNAVETFLAKSVLACADVGSGGRPLIGGCDDDCDDRDYEKKRRSGKNKNKNARRRGRSNSVSSNSSNGNTSSMAGSDMKGEEEEEEESAGVDLEEYGYGDYSAEMEESGGWMFSWIEFMKKTKLLSLYLKTTSSSSSSTKSVVSSNATEEDDMFASQMRIDLPGINANDLNKNERQFIEMALLDSFMKVMNNLNYKVVSSYFVSGNNSGISSNGIMSLVGGAGSTSNAAAAADTDDAYYVRQHDHKWNDFLDDLLCGMGLTSSEKQRKNRSRRSHRSNSRRGRRDSFDIPDHVVIKLNRFHREACAVLGLDSPLKLHHRFWIISKKTNQSGKIMELWQEDFQKSLARCEYETLSEVAEDCIITIEHINAIEPEQQQVQDSENTNHQQEDETWREVLMKDLILHGIRNSRKTKDSDDES